LKVEKPINLCDKIKIADYLNPLSWAGVYKNWAFGQEPLLLHDKLKDKVLKYLE
jgi:hypothetical protein